MLAFILQESLLRNKPVYLQEAYSHIATTAYNYVVARVSYILRYHAISDILIKVLLDRIVSSLLCKIFEERLSVFQSMKKLTHLSLCQSYLNLLSNNLYCRTMSIHCWMPVCNITHITIYLWLVLYLRFTKELAVEL